jgi:hypothetical protein
MMQSNSTLHTKRLSVKTCQAFSLLWAHTPGYEHRGVSWVRTSSRCGYVTTALEMGELARIPSSD